MAAREGFARIGLVLLVLSWLFITLLGLGSLAWLLFTSWDAWHKRGETGSIANLAVYGWIPAFVGLGIANLLTWILMGFLDKAGDK
jgi:hypothetical protein